jgi:hypothetical protein
MGRSLLTPNKRWMDKNIPLLFDPPYILHPDVVLTQSVTMDTYHRKENDILVKCENCGKPLGSLLYHFWNPSEPSYGRRASMREYRQ